MKFFKLIFSFMLLIGVIFFIKESLPKGKMEIIPVSQLSKTYPKKNKDFHRTDYYLIRNYVKNDATDALLDKIICDKIIQYKSDNHFSYHGYFYKESWLVNLERISKKDDTIDMFGANIYLYSWRKDKGSKVMKYTNYNDLPNKEEVWISCKNL